jgi:hypothetical protein
VALDLETPVREGFTTFMTFIPKLIGFLVILLVGYLIAKLIAKAVDAVLERVGFDGAVERGGVKKAMAKSKYDASDIVAKLVFFAVFIPFLSAAVGALGIQALQEPLAAFIALIPRIIVAIVLVVVGALIAGTVKSFITNALGGLSYGSILANAAAVLILFGFVKSALDQVGIATAVTGALLYATLAAVAGVVIVGVGGGLDQADAAPLGGHADQGQAARRTRSPLRPPTAPRPRHRVVRHGGLPGRPDHPQHRLDHGRPRPAAPTPPRGTAPPARRTITKTLHPFRHRSPARPRAGLRCVAGRGTAACAELCRSRRRRPSPTRRSAPRRWRPRAWTRYAPGAADVGEPARALSPLGPPLDPPRTGGPRLELVLPGQQVLDATPGLDPVTCTEVVLVRPARGPYA